MMFVCSYRAYFQPTNQIKVARVVCRQASCWSPQVQQSSSWSSVRVPIWIFHQESETTVLSVLSDIMEAVDEDVVILALCDLSAKYCDVRHGRPCIFTQTSTSLIRFWGHCASLVQIVSRRSKTIGTSRLKSVRFKMVSCVIPQGLVPGPIFFIMYTPNLNRIIEHHGLLPHHFNATQARVSAWTDEIMNWMRSNRLQLNADKTESGVPLQTIFLYFWLLRLESAVRSTHHSQWFLTSEPTLTLICRREPTLRRHDCGLLHCTLPDSQHSAVAATISDKDAGSVTCSRLDYGNVTLTGITSYPLCRLQDSSLATLGAQRHNTYQSSLASCRSMHQV